MLQFTSSFRCPARTTFVAKFCGRFGLQNVLIIRSASFSCAKNNSVSVSGIAFGLPGDDCGIGPAAVLFTETNIWIGGEFLAVYGVSYPYLAVLHPDGTLNTNFPSSLQGNTGPVHALAVDSSGHIYAGGKNGVARLAPNGSTSWLLDTSFAFGFLSVSEVTALAVRSPDSTLWVGNGYGMTMYDVYGNPVSGFQLSPTLTAGHFNTEV